MPLLEGFESLRVFVKEALFRVELARAHEAVLIGFETDEAALFIDLGPAEFFELGVMETSFSGGGVARLVLGSSDGYANGW